MRSARSWAIAAVLALPCRGASTDDTETFVAMVKKRLGVGEPRRGRTGLRLSQGERT